MKKVFALFLSVAMVFSLAACGGGTSPSGDGTPSPAGTAPATPADGTVYTIKVNSTFPDLAESSQQGYYINKWFFDEITKRTDGHVVFDTYYNGALYKSNEILDAMQGGALDMAFVTPHAYGEVVPEGFVTTMPLWTDSPLDAHKAFRETEIWTLLEEGFKEVNMRPLSCLFVDNYGFMSKTPINSTADLKGKLIRSSGTLYKLWFDELGMVSVDINASEGYDAIQKGTLDIDCQGWSTLNTLKLGEVVEYCVYPQYQHSVGMCMFISESLFQSLPKEYQDIIMEVSLECEALANSDESAGHASSQVEEYVEEYEIEFSTIEDADRLIESATVMFDYWGGMNDRCAKMADAVYDWAEWEK